MKKIILVEVGDCLTSMRPRFTILSDTVPSDERFKEIAEEHFARFGSNHVVTFNEEYGLFEVSGFMRNWLIQTREIDAYE